METLEHVIKVEVFEDCASGVETVWSDLKSSMPNQVVTAKDEEEEDWEQKTNSLSMILLTEDNIKTEGEYWTTHIKGAWVLFDILLVYCILSIFLNHADAVFHLFNVFDPPP